MATLLFLCDEDTVCVGVSRGTESFSHKNKSVAIFIVRNEFTRGKLHFHQLSHFSNLLKKLPFPSTVSRIKFREFCLMPA